MLNIDILNVLELTCDKIAKSPLIISTLIVTLLIQVLAEFVVKRSVNKVYDKEENSKEAVKKLRLMNGTFMSKVSFICSLIHMIIIMTILNDVSNFFIALIISFYYLTFYIVFVSYMQLLIINTTFNKIRNTKYKIIDQIRPILINSCYTLIMFTIMLLLLMTAGYINISISCILLFFFILMLPYIKLICSPIIFKCNFKAREFNIEDIREKEVKDIIDNIMKKLSVNNYKLYIWDAEETKTANAYVCGIFKKVIFISSYLIDNLSNKEIEATIMHEAGHIKNKHISKRIRKELLIIFITMILLFLLFMILECNSSSGSEISMIFVTTISVLITNIIIRKGKLKQYRAQEEEADKYVIDSGIDKDVFINALTKIYDLNDIDLEEDNKLKKSLTHPDLKARIDYIRKYKEIDYDKVDYDKVDDDKKDNDKE